jgi:hypothetical protein
MNTAWPRRVSLIISGRLPTIPSPTIGVSSGVSPGCPTIRLNRLSPALQASSFTRRLAHPRRPNRVHRDDPPGPPMLRTGRSRSVAPHPALLRRSYGSIPHDSSPHGSGLPPLYLPAFSGARVRPSRAQKCPNGGGVRSCPHAGEYGPCCGRGRPLSALPGCSACFARNSPGGEVAKLLLNSAGAMIQ